MKTEKEQDSERAEYERAALRRFMEKEGLEQTAWCKAAGVSEGTLRNFLEGRSGSMTQRILHKLATAAGATVAEMLGYAKDSLILEEGLIKIVVRAEVEAGKWGAAVELPAEERETIYVSKPDSSSNYYGVRVRGTSMNLLYPEGTILICVKIQDFNGELCEDDKVVVRRRNSEGKFETTVKVIQADSQGRIWLVPKSTDPQWEAVQMPRPDFGSDNFDQASDIEILAVVVAVEFTEDRRGRKPLNLWG